MRKIFSNKAVRCEKLIRTLPFCSKIIFEHACFCCLNLSCFCIFYFDVLFYSIDAYTSFFLTDRVVYTRRRVTASARQRMARERHGGGDDPAPQEVVPYVDPPADDPPADDPPVQEDAGDVADAGDAEGEDLEQIRPPLLPRFQEHVALKIWNGQEREPIKIHSHTSKLRRWTYQGDAETSLFVARLDASRLHTFAPLSYRHTNQNLLQAFFERWHPETNTFHMPFGEMTITLDDVWCLTGLDVTRRGVLSTRIREGM